MKESSYTRELADEICERLAGGKTLNEICRDANIPPVRTVRRWVIEDRDGFAARYARARDLQLEFWSDEIVEISDDGSNDWMERTDDRGRKTYVLNGENIQRSRLRSDNRKWLLSKLRPDKYGDRVENKTTINLADPIAELLKQVAEQGTKVYDPKS